MTWRDHIKIHPAADLFPMMSDEELKALAADITNTRMNVPVVLFKDGKDYVLLDGRNRLEALDKHSTLKVRQKWCYWPKKIPVHFLDDAVDPYDFVLSLNIHRRHLTTEQRRDLVAKLIAAQPDKSDRQIAKQAKVSPTTVGTQRAKLEADGLVSKLDSRTDARGSVRKAHRDKVVEAAAEQGITSDEVDRVLDAVETYKNKSNAPTPQQSAEQRKAVYAAEIEILEEPPQGDTKEEQFTNAVRSFMGELSGRRAYWKKLFGDYRQFKIDIRTAAMLAEAAGEWEKMVRELLEMEAAQ